MANPSENIARDRAFNFRHARTMQRRAATASLIGSVIEWYDFFIFGTAAALVFPKLFFANAAGGSVASSFFTMFVGFLARKGLEGAFDGRHFDREIIVLCVRWYLRYKLSLRDLAEMMAERGLSLAHAPTTEGSPVGRKSLWDTTIMRWVKPFSARPSNIRASLQRRSRSMDTLPRTGLCVK